MDTYAAQPRRFPAVGIVIVLFILCIYPGQYLLTQQFPAIAGLAQFKPSLVFLEIPIQVPFTIDMVLTPALFIVLYPLVLLFSPARRVMGQRMRAAFTGLFALLVCILIGGLLYYVAQAYLPLAVRTGINTFGFNADIHLSYPGLETISLRGSGVLLIGFIIGLIICIRKVAKAPANPLTAEQRMTPYNRMLQEKRQQQKAGFNVNQRQPEVIASPAVQYQPKSKAGFCINQPVATLKPEAAYYMPKW